MNNNNEKLRVWWIPQVGKVKTPFYVPVETVEEGKKLLDILGTYDAYQLQNKIKPDYSNCGGLQMFDEKFEEWCDWFYETDDVYFDEIDAYLEHFGLAEKLEEISEEIFNQVDWSRL